jgi:hypothetical protein
VWDVAPTELREYFETHSINIPRLRRSGIREFASSIIIAPEPPEELWSSHSQWLFPFRERQSRTRFAKSR